MVEQKGWRKAEHSADVMATLWVEHSDDKMADKSVDVLVVRMEGMTVEY